MNRAAIAVALLTLGGCASAPPPEYDLSFTPAPGTQAQNLSTAEKYCEVTADLYVSENYPLSVGVAQPESRSYNANCSSVGSSTNCRISEGSYGSGLAGAIRASAAQRRLDAQRRDARHSRFDQCMLEHGYLVDRVCIANCPG